MNPPITRLEERYEIGALIGRGGMAEVHDGHDLRLDRPVAVKCLRGDIAHQPGVRERFETEARLAARLSHPNVVAVYDSGEEAGIPYIVMERLPGRTFYDRLQEGPLPVEEVRSVARQVLGSLAAAHGAGVLHRDIKPGNILAGNEPGVWKVGDFGIAKAVEMAPGDHTLTGMMMGTPAYLAPERLAGGPATVASDLYALGVVLFEALTGQKPIGAGELHLLRPDADSGLVAAVGRALDPDPARRFNSAEEMAAAILVAPGAAPTTATPYGPPLEAPAPTEVFEAGPYPAGGGSQHRLRRALMAASAVLAAALIAVAAAGAADSGKHRPSTSPSTGSGSAAGAGTPAQQPAGAGALPPDLNRAITQLEKEVRP